MAIPLRPLALGAVLALTTALAYQGARRALRPPPPAPPASIPARALNNSAASTPPPPEPAGPAELALVSPLAPGGDLAGFTVREIRRVERGRVPVVCARDRAVVRLEVALADPEGTLPPATAGRYAVFYSLRGATPEDGERLAKKLATVIAGNPTAAPPAGMTTFTPEPTPPIEL